MRKAVHTVNAGAYKVRIGNAIWPLLKEFLRKNKYSTVFILVDENTWAHCYPVLLSKVPSLTSARTVEIRSGEQNKTIQTCISLWNSLAEHEADRQSLLINLGGGVIGDVGGFVASTFMRGIHFIHIPTTLLSQVDASVGGKLGIDLGSLKNQVGVFGMPREVFIDPGFLSTLAERELYSGFAEVIKHSLIRDRKFWDDVIKTGDLKNSDLTGLIHRSVNIKSAIVRKDPLESGLRKVLNFGHTVGHALESNSLEKGISPMLHGEAVAAGMLCEAWLSYKKRLLSKEELEEVTTYLLYIYKSWIFNKFDELRVLELMKHDKKNRGGEYRFSLLKGIGKAVYDVKCSTQLVRDALSYYRDQEGS